MRERLPIAAVLVAALIGAAGFSSCTFPEAIREAGSGCAAPTASLVYVIQGEGHMTYHDASGSQHDAAEEKTAEAVALAEDLRSAEVFILRSSPAGFFLLPSGDVDVFHYCKGLLAGRGSFSRSPGESDFDIAAQVAGEQGARGSMRRVLVYYGHTLEEGEGAPSGGVRSVNEHATVGGLARALEAMARRGGAVDTLDLVVLSACQSTTPAILQAVAPYARYLLASPADLHLSHMDTDALGLLESKPGISTRDLADSIATWAFRRLLARTRTELTLARFDLDAVRREGMVQAGASESLASNGLRLWYRPAQFGKKARTVQENGTIRQSSGE